MKTALFALVLLAGCGGEPIQEQMPPCSDIHDIGQSLCPGDQTAVCFSMLTGRNVMACEAAGGVVCVEHC